AGRLSLEEYSLTPGRQHPGDGLEESRLARAVRPDDRHGLAVLDRRRDAEQRLEVAVEGVEGVDGKQGHLTPPARDRFRAPRARRARHQADLPQSAGRN